jgi:hypothetical protein
MWRLTLELSFNTKKLRKICSQQRKLKREFGEKFTEVKAIISDIEAAANLGELSEFYEFGSNNTECEIEISSMGVKVVLKPVPRIGFSTLEDVNLYDVVRLKIQRIEIE